MYNLRFAKFDEVDRFYITSSDMKYVYGMNSKFVFSTLCALIKSICVHEMTPMWSYITTEYEILFEFKDLNDLKNNHPELFI